jgi:hypothetical protein
MMLEYALNRVMKTLLLEVMLGGQNNDGYKVSSLHVVCDDDKMPWEGKTNLAFLQASRHVRRNWKGFVCHHVVLTASGILLGCSFKRDMDTTETTTKRIIMSQFFATQGGNLQLAVPDMTFLRAFGDRAYQTKSLLESFFLKGGTGIHGTIARNLRNPFTFDQKLKDSDERTNVPTAGGKTLFIKEAEVHGIPLYAFAFRNGYKGVILTISSMFSGYEWDCVLKDPGDYQWHVLHQAKEIPCSEVVQRSFHPLGSKSTNSKAPQIFNDMVNLISTAPIQPTTMMQRGADWFNNRGMSLTSRSVEQGVSTFSGDEDELKHGTSWRFVKSFVAAAGSRSYVQQNDDETTDDEESKDESNDENDTGGKRFIRIKATNSQLNVPPCRFLVQLSLLPPESSYIKATSLSKRGRSHCDPGQQNDRGNKSTHLKCEYM